MKVIKVDTPRGVYHLPLKIVAKNYADYYATERNGISEDREEYKEEFTYIMDDVFQGIDWLLNSMYWSDVKDNATKVSDEVNITDDDFFTSSDGMEIIDLSS